MNGIFRNPPGSPGRIPGLFELPEILARMVLARIIPERPPGSIAAVDDSEQGTEPGLEPPVTRHTTGLATQLSVTWLGHAAFLIRIGGKTILTDPFLGRIAGRFGIGPRRYAPPAMTVHELPDIDILLISHNHYDHLDIPTLRQLKGKERIQVIAPLRLGNILRHTGLRNIQELDWWQGHDCGSVKVRLLPAIHRSGRGLFDSNKTLWGSFGIYCGSTAVWFSGDTAYGAIFPEIGKRAGPFDLAMVGIGAYMPRIVMRGVHALPEEAVRILREIGAQKGIGMHYGAIRLSWENRLEPPKRFKAAAAEQGYGADNAIILKTGETLVVP